MHHKLYQITFLVVFFLLFGVAAWLFQTRFDEFLVSAPEIRYTEEVPQAEIIYPDTPQVTTSTADEIAFNPFAREVRTTRGVKHSVPLMEIVSGGPGQDDIPSIDAPVFLSQEDVNFLSESDVGIAYSQDGIDRFYPFQILVWHELVNDTYPSGPVLISYCPLCYSAVVFDPLVDGERAQFGTSGKLWQSNLVMYDRKTNSYWSQILGEAIVGPATGQELAILPSDIMEYGEWKHAHPNGTVLSKETGAIRAYGTDPYGDYYTSPGTFFPVRSMDTRLGDKELVHGMMVNGKAKAYHAGAIKAAGVIEDDFGDVTIVAEYIMSEDIIRFYRADEDGKKMRLETIPSFWFSWVAAHPDTELFL